MLAQPDDDVVPFVTTACGGSVRLIGWDSLDEELQEKFLTHVLPPAVAAQPVEMVSLVITTYLTPMAGDGSMRPGRERYEALLIAALSKTGDELTLQARVHRAAGDPPRLADFEVLADTLPPAFTQPLHEGLFG